MDKKAMEPTKEFALKVIQYALMHLESNLDRHILQDIFEQDNDWEPQREHWEAVRFVLDHMVEIASHGENFLDIGQPDQDTRQGDQE